MGTLRVEPINTDQSNRTNSQTSLDNVVTDEQTNDELPLITAGPNPQTQNERERPTCSILWTVRSGFGLAAICIGIFVWVSRHSRTNYVAQSPIETDTKYRTDYFPSDYKPEDPLKSEPCNTIECQTAVKQILSSLNTSVDPCENFYEYACQGWQANNPRPIYSPEWNVFTKLEKKTSDMVSEILSKSLNTGKPVEHFPALELAKNFYQDCMVDRSKFDKVQNDVKITTLTPLGQLIKKFKSPDVKLIKNGPIYNIILNTLNQHGGWPMLLEQGAWNSSEFDLIKSMVTMKKKFASSIFLDIISLREPFYREVNNSIYISRASSSGTLVDSFISKATKEFRTIYALKDFIVNVSKELLMFQGKTNINETYLENRACEIIFVKGELQTSGKTKADPVFKLLHGISRPFMKTNAIDLHNLLDAYTHPSKNPIQISQLLLKLYYPIITGQVDRTIKVENIDYLLSISKFITIIDQEALANYIMFQMVLNMIPFSTQTMQDHLNSFQNAVWGTSEEKPKQQICTSLTQEKFQLAVGQAYVQQRSFHQFHTVTTIFENVKEAFTDLVTRSTISYINKTILLAELEVTELCLGYPNILLDKNKVQSEYYGLSFNQTTFLEKLMTVNTWLTNKQLKVINENHEMTSECKWFRFAGTINAYNQLQDFQVYFPLGILQAPFYNFGLPRAISYGTLGSILGHEIIHGLVGLGLSEHKNGSLTPVSKCLVNQYGNFSTPELHEKNITIDGRITLAENIPDNAGLLGAYQAYNHYFRMYPKLPAGLSEFSEDQLFFIGFAQNWCNLSSPESFQNTVKNDKHGPGMFRVLGTLQNSKEFANTWNCPVGSKMNPAPSEHVKCNFFESE